MILYIFSRYFQDNEYFLKYSLSFMRSLFIYVITYNVHICTCKISKIIIYVIYISLYQIGISHVFS